MGSDCVNRDHPTAGPATMHEGQITYLPDAILSDRDRAGAPARNDRTREILAVQSR
jgi:hypothetical protein